MEKLKMISGVFMFTLNATKTGSVSSGWNPTGESIAVNGERAKLLPYMSYAKVESTAIWTLLIVGKGPRTISRLL